MTYLTAAEVASLLAIAASFDNRKANEEAVTAWRVALTGIAFRDARNAIAAHYAESRDWIMPADIRARVKRVRAKRISEHPALNPPPGLTDADEIRWISETRRRIGDGERVDVTHVVTSAPPHLRQLIESASPADLTEDLQSPQIGTQQSTEDA